MTSNTNAEIKNQEPNDESEYSSSYVDQNTSQIEAQFDAYHEAFKEARWETWLDFAETTTLHGPIHITKTSGRLRVYYSTVVAFMTVMFFSHATYLLLQYLSFPVLTEIKYSNIDFSYPDITICPNSPFTQDDLNKFPDLQLKYNESKSFWWQSKHKRLGSPRLKMKHSMLPNFYPVSKELGKKPYHHILDCQVMKKECLEDFHIREHPNYYRCFTLDIRQNPPVQAGPTQGIRLILHRGQINSDPLLMVVNEDPFLLQSVEYPSSSRVQDGFFIAFHEQDTFPSFPVQQLASSVTLRYGESVRISLDQIHFEAINLKGRECTNKETAPPIKLVRLDKESRSKAKRSEADEDSLAKFNYTRQACMALYRQKLTYKRCKCFSEDYAIPHSMRDIGQVWCHDLLTSTNKIINIEETLKCVATVADMTDHEILQEVPFEHGDGLPGCPLGCNRKLHSIHSVLRTRIVQDLDPKQLIPYFEMLELRKITDSHVTRETTTVKAEDLIILDIHPVSEMVNQIIEGEGYHLARFISDLGGISGLYVGITIYTLAEIVDFIVRFLSVYLPYLWNLTDLELVQKKHIGYKLKSAIAEMMYSTNNRSAKE